MRLYRDSEIFNKMNAGNSIITQLNTALGAVNDSTIVNRKIQDSLDTMYKQYKDGVTLKVIQAVKDMSIYVVYLPIDKRLPANMPFVRVKRHGKDCIIVDISKYATIERSEENNTITGVSVDIPKLYNLLVPALIAQKVLTPDTVISMESTKWMALMWAKMFCHILKTQKFFVANAERYEAFNYFAMKFFMLYYLGLNEAIANRIAGEFIDNVKSKYIQMIENVCAQKKINLYESWTTFARSMFSNEITNIRTNGLEMNVEQYIRLFSTYLGRDGAYLALWSADYFFFCLFNAYNHSWILNDRAWAAVVEDNPKNMVRMLSGLYREL